MDAASFAELATWLRQAVFVEKLHLSILPVSPARGCDEALFRRAYEFWKAHWFRRMRYGDTASSEEEQRSIEQSYSAVFLSSDEVVLFSTPSGIVAIGTLHRLDLDAFDKRFAATLPSLGPDWTEMHRREGVRTVLYGANLVGDPAHDLNVKAPSTILGRLYVVAMLRNFLTSGIDMGLCRMRRKTKMDTHAEFVGGKKEGEVHVPGKGEELGDIMTISQETAKLFPFEPLGKAFNELWVGRSTEWSQVVWGTAEHK